MMSETKQCTKCKRQLPLTTDYYFKDRYHKSGFKSQCKECLGVKFFIKQQFIYPSKELYGKHGIYKIENIINKKLYVGSSVNIYSRWCVHLDLLRKNKHENQYLQNAFNKYGENNFIFNIIEIVNDKNDLLNKEQYWIDKLKVCDRTIGYNLNPIAGNSLGRNTSEQTKEKLKLINNIEIIQLSLDGEFIKEWISGHEAARQLNYKSSNINRCVNGFIKTYKNYLWVKKGDYNNNNYINRITKSRNRPIIQYDMNVNIIKKWDSVSNAQKITGIWNIRSACIGVQKSAGGFIWRFEDNIKNAC